MSGCESSTHSLEGAYSDVIDNLTASDWIHTEIENSPNGTISMSSEIWTFHKTGKGSHKVVFSDNKGLLKEDVYYFQWAFTTPNYSVICMDIQQSGLLYWQIITLSNENLEIVQAANDPVLYPEIDKRYVLFHH